MIVPTVTKIMPTENEVRFNLVLMDGETEVINKDYSDLFSLVEGPKAKNKSAIKKKMQVDIDKYKATKAVYILPAYATIAIAIQSELEV